MERPNGHPYRKCIIHVGFMKEVTKVKTEKLTIFLGALLIVLLAFLIIWKAGIFGVSRNRLEQDARESQKISSNWEVVQGVNEELCAMLFYDDDKDEYTYSVYLTKDGISYGYFFREGGSGYPYIEEGVQGIIYEDKGIALMSLNDSKVSRIVVDNNVTEETIEVNPLEPFAVVLPVNCGEITMYDSMGNIVTLYDTYKG